MAATPNFAFFPVAGWEGLPREKRPKDGKLCPAEPSFWPGSFSEPRPQKDGTILTHGGSDIIAPPASQILYPGGVPGTAWANEKLGDMKDSFPWWKKGGWHCYVLSDDGFIYYFAHMQTPPLLRPGMRVNPGQVIGLVGRTGNVTSSCSHLHFQIYPFVNGVKSNRAIDPYPYLKATWPGASAKKKLIRAAKWGITIGVVMWGLGVLGAGGWLLYKYIKS